ncbi:MAG: phosphoketolase [Oleispira sp.]|jgi:phosphoketolase
MLTPEQAQSLVEQGAICLRGHCQAEVQIIAIGSYQLQQALLLSDRLIQNNQAHSLMYMLEPGRFRFARDDWEQHHQSNTQLQQALFPDKVKQRLFFFHGHPEAILACCRPLDLGPARTTALGYINQGGTLNTEGMLFANKCTWAHGALTLARRLGLNDDAWLSEAELAATLGIGDPYQLIKRPF